MNRTIIVGRLTADPNLRYSPSGTAVCKFTVAVNRLFKSDNGQDADFISCVTFKKSAENIANFISKGSLVGVDGRLQTRSYEKDGTRVYVTEIIADSVHFWNPKSKGGFK